MCSYFSLHLRQGYNLVLEKYCCILYEQLLSYTADVRTVRVLDNFLNTV